MAVNNNKKMCDVTSFRFQNLNLMMGKNNAVFIPCGAQSFMYIEEYRIGFCVLQFGLLSFWTFSIIQYF